MFKKLMLISAVLVMPITASATPYHAAPLMLGHCAPGVKGVKTLSVIGGGTMLPFALATFGGFGMVYLILSDTPAPWMRIASSVEYKYPTGVR